MSYKITIKNWAREKATETILLPLGFKHDKVFEDNDYEVHHIRLHNTMDTIFNAGLNVAMTHGPGKDHVVLVVDKRLFHTRG